ncbi:ATP-binding protein [Pollutibacter soli]|uniref:ATP-binding protein n=1 Tax=Pollutibacter soli TaxID=3034157 RepID=UPI0030135333
MRKLQLVNCFLLRFTSVHLLIASFLLSCNQNTSVPFPDTALPQPKTVPLRFSEEKQIQWTEIPGDSIENPVKQTLDLSRLPENKFVINDFKPFTSAPQQKKLNWNQIPESIINLDTITTESIPDIKKNVLPKPVITRAAMPKLMANSSSGIMQFSEEEGLPGTSVNASLIDKQGVIWLAVGRKLVRYTGDQLYTWSFMPRNTIADAAVITHLALDSMGRMWVGTLSDGAYILDIDHDSFWFFPSSDRVADMLCDHQGMMWVASVNRSLLLIDPVTMKFRSVFATDSLLNDHRPLTLIEDAAHNIWLGQNNKISVIDSTRKRIKIIGNDKLAGLNAVLELYQDLKGNVWVGSFNREFYSVSLNEDLITTYSKKNGTNTNLFDITEDRIGRMWISARDTIYIINKDKSAFKIIPLNARIFQRYKSTLFTDPSGNIWAGTLNNGLLVFDADNVLPQHFDKRNGLVDGNVWGTFEENDGTIWIGTNSGLNIYNPVTSSIRTLSKTQGLHGNDVKVIGSLGNDELYAGNIPGFTIFNKKKKTFENYGKDQGFPRAVFSITADSSGNWWVASVPELMVYNREKKNLKKLDYHGGLIGTACYGLITDKKGLLWVATDSGLMIIDQHKNSIRYLREKEGMPSDFILKVMESGSGDIWVAGMGGISIISTDKNTITNITAKEGLLPADIYDLLEKDGIMYAGSSSGLFQIFLPDSSKGPNSHDKKFRLRNFNKKEGFPFNDHNQMAGMVRRNGEIWLGVTPVLTILTETTNRIDSAPAQVMVTGISALDHPLSFDTKTQPLPELPLTDSLKNAAEKIPAVPISEQAAFLTQNRIRYDSATAVFHIPSGLSLPHNQNSLNFSYSNPSITGRDKIVYRYILEGEDEEWSAETPRPFTRNYYNLKPGHYTFKVASKGFNGVWSEPASLQFPIRPPWWLTWWAYILYAGVFAGTAWLVAGYRSRRLKRENQILEEKVTHRTAQLNKSLEDLKLTQSQLVQSEKMASLGELTAGIAHEIQNPLNFINNFSDVSMELLGEMENELDNGNSNEAKLIANDVKSNLEKVIHHGKRADSIVKGMLQHSRGNSGVKEPVDLNAMADEYLRLSYQGLRAKDKSFNTHFETHFDPAVGTVQVVPQDIGRVLLNIYNNAFYAVYEKKRTSLNGYSPLVKVSTRKKNNVIEISVKDNGNGIPDKVADKIFQPFFTTKPTGQGTGLGLSLSYDIVKAHGGEIIVKSDEKEGTEFIITLSNHI